MRAFNKRFIINQNTSFRNEISRRKASLFYRQIVQYPESMNVVMQSKEYSKIIYWDTQYKGIRVLNQKRLQQIILPKYFRHNRFPSFVRQLNMYDFHKVHLEDHHSYFCHENFDPRNKQNMHLIRRKVTFENKIQDQKHVEIKEDYPDQKQFFSFASSFLKSSDKFFCKKSIKILASERDYEQDDRLQEMAMDEIIQILIGLKENKIEFNSKLKYLKENPRYCRILRKKDFIQMLYTKLGLQIDNIEISLSELSIEGELLIKTRKSLPAKSLKWVDSGHFIYRKETIRNFLNI